MGTHTAADIVALIRQTSNGEFSLSGSEAELLLKLYASAEIEQAKGKVVTFSPRPVVQVGDHAPEYTAMVDAVREQIGAKQ